MTDTIRCFLAIELSAELVQALKKVSDDLKNQGAKGVRWVHPDNIHLTLQFLGEISGDMLACLKKSLLSVVKEFPYFPVAVRGLGAFSSTRKPRVIWIGITPSNEIIALQKSIEMTCSRCGIQPEERSFSPHLTLGRVSKTCSPEELSQLSRILTTTQIQHLGSMQAQRVTLFRSELRPSGPVYSRIAQFPLAGLCQNPTTI